MDNPIDYIYDKLYNSYVYINELTVSNYKELNNVYRN